MPPSLAADLIGIAIVTAVALTVIAALWLTGRRERRERKASQRRLAGTMTRRERREWRRITEAEDFTPDTEYADGEWGRPE